MNPTGPYIPTNAVDHYDLTLIADSDDPTATLQAFARLWERRFKSPLFAFGEASSNASCVPDVASENVRTSLAASDYRAKLRKDCQYVIDFDASDDWIENFEFSRAVDVARSVLAAIDRDANRAAYHRALLRAALLEIEAASNAEGIVFGPDPNIEDKLRAALMQQSTAKL